MRCKFILFLVIAIVFLPGNLIANRDNEPDTLLRNKNRDQFYFTAMGEGISYSLGYRNIIQDNKNGLVAHKLSSSYFPNEFTTFNYAIEKETGNYNNHLVLGIGCTFLIRQILTNRYDRDYSKTAVYYRPHPFISLGYSYHNASKKMSYRFDIIYPSYLFNYYPWAGFTVGYNFNRSIHLFKKYFPSCIDDKKMNKIDAGFESEIGYGIVYLEKVGKLNSYTNTNSIFLKYYLKGIYLKGSIGITSFFIKRLRSSNGNEVEIFNEYPRLFNVGIGMGVPLNITDKLVVAPEFSIGYYLNSIKKIDIKPISDYITYNNFTTLENYEHTPLFYSIGMTFNYNIAPKYELQLGISYKKSSIFNSNKYLSYINDWYINDRNNLIVKTYNISLGIQYLF